MKISETIKGTTPIIPDYAGANVRGIIPALLGPSTWKTSLPTWMPVAVTEATQVVLLVLDGLGWDQLQTFQHLTPTLAAMSATRITTVAPTTTATALSSITTGLTPGEHGLLGYRMMLGGEVINVLRWAVEGQDRRRSQPPRDIQRYQAFLGEQVPVVGPVELLSSSFTEAHLSGCRPVGVRAASSIAVAVREQLMAGERFVYAYYAGIDKIAHERGFGDYYDAELRAADRIVAEMLSGLPRGAVLLVTADHGQVEVGERIVYPSAALLSLVSNQSGEGRFRWLHAHRGAANELLNAAMGEFAPTGWVRTREQVIAENWFGPSISTPVASRLGDVAIVAFDDVSYDDPADTGPFALQCRHGSLTSAEVYVPLLAGGNL